MAVPWVQALVVGAGAASIGMTFYVIIRSIKAIGPDYIRLGIGATMFVLLYVFKLPLLLVFIVGAPLSIAVSYFRLRRAKARKA
jgi:chromate transport protein ChrA